MQHLLPGPMRVRSPRRGLLHVFAWAVLCELHQEVPLRLGGAPLQWAEPLHAAQGVASLPQPAPHPELQTGRPEPTIHPTAIKRTFYSMLSLYRSWASVCV